jgi:hypothetical protein
MFVTSCTFVYAIYLPTNVRNKIQQTTNHKTQYVIPVTHADGTLVPKQVGLYLSGIVFYDL